MNPLVPSPFDVIGMVVLSVLFAAVVAVVFWWAIRGIREDHRRRVARRAARAPLN